MPTQRYTRADGATGTHVVSMSITAWDDGTYTGTLSSWEPGGERIRCYSIPQGVAMAGVVPPGLEALAAAAQWAIDEWGDGRLR